LSPLDLPDLTLTSLERDASTARPEARQTHLAADLANTQLDSARSALLPQVTFHAAFAADRQQFIHKGGANWLASLGLRWNLINGLGDKARIEESSHWLERAHADEQRVDSAVRLEVRRAWPTCGRRSSGLRWRKQPWRRPRKAFALPRTDMRPE
jgi:outer membrane protein TolC